MALSLSDMRAEVRLNIKRKAEGIANTYIDRWINWSQDALADVHTWEEMRKRYEGTTTADKKYYNFPDRMKDIHSLIFDSDAITARKLRYMHPRDFDEQVPYPDAYTGRSTVYVDFGTYFELWRVPDDAYTMLMRCSIYPAELAADDAESALVRKDALIVAGATVFGFRALKEIEDANYWEREVCPRLLARALATDHSAEDWTPVARPFRTTSSSFYDGDHTNPWNSF